MMTALPFSLEQLSWKQKSIPHFTCRRFSLHPNTVLYELSLEYLERTAVPLGAIQICTYMCINFLV